MTVTRNPGDQDFRDAITLTGSATTFSETVTATGALNPLIPVSFIEILGTATTVIDTYTLATVAAQYEGMEKFVFTKQSATDSVGIAKVEVAVAEGDPAVNIISMEYPNGFMGRIIDGEWKVFPALAAGAILTAATAST